MTRALLALVIAAGLCGGLAAGEADLLDEAIRFYEGGDYHSAITEVMRYQCLFPAGRSFGLSMLVMGKAYYRGNNYRAALRVFYACGRDFAGKPEGEEALYLAGHIQLLKGEPPDAAATMAEYRKRYPAGRFTEELDRDACFTAALARDRGGAAAAARAYRDRYPRGRYGADLDRLERAGADDAARKRRHLWISVLGSAVLPGFGQFYTGHYTAGLLSLLSNALFIFMICNGALMNNTFQIVFFSLAEAVVYQYNIYSAVRTVNEYNAELDRGYFRSVRLGITSSF